MAVQIYVHQKGQFWLETSGSKVATLMGKKLFIEIAHDLAFSYFPKFKMVGNESKLTCNPDMNHHYDDCFQEVTNKK